MERLCNACRKWVTASPGEEALRPFLCASCRALPRDPAPAPDPPPPSSRRDRPPGETPAVADLTTDAPAGVLLAPVLTPSMLDVPLETLAGPGSDATAARGEGGDVRAPEGGGGADLAASGATRPASGGGGAPLPAPPDAAAAPRRAVWIVGVAALLGILVAVVVVRGGGAPPEQALPSPPLAGNAPAPPLPGGAASEAARASPVARAHQAAPSDEAPREPPSAPEVAERGSFDRAAASKELAVAAEMATKCRFRHGPTGEGKVAVTFAADGSVVRASVIEAPFVGTETGSCVEKKFRSVKLKPFTGDEVTLYRAFQIP